ncbi:MAG: AfsR/SARP family transcriptional regulator, partial [bacterium]|nr:AfsR/SARP family transcriptional regulator [bacterium]
LTVLTALGLRGSGLLDPGAPPGERDVRTRLLDALVDSRTLILFDNCEHLIDSAAQLADLILTRCPGVRILATSREALGISGEELFAVPPLGMPAADSSVEDAIGHDAVRLFADRAGSLHDGFVLDDSNVAAVVEICRRLDGLPLAIELAAARTRSLPVDEIARRLSDRFRLLTGGSRTAMPRHRTLRAVVEWSWDLMSADEVLLADRLSVFPGGSTPASAAAVVDGAWTQTRVDDVLAALVDKSILTLTDDTETRYRMLETIREYGTERLVDAGEIAEVRQLHARYFRDVAEAAAPHLMTAGQVPWFRLLARERDNMLAALRFTIDSGDAATAIRTTAAMGMYWMLRGSHTEASDWLRAALEVPGESDPDSRLTVEALNAFGALAGAEGMAQAEQTIEVLERARDSSAPIARGLAALALPLMQLINGDIATAMRGIDEGLQNDDPWIRAAVRMLRGLFSENAGDPASLRADLTLALEEFTALGERWGRATTLAGLAGVMVTEGDVDEALAAYEEAHDLLIEIDASDDLAFMRIRIAQARLRNGDIDRARAELLEVVASTEKSGAMEQRAFALTALADLARLDGDLAVARVLCDEILLDVARLTGAPQVKAWARFLVARLDIADGDLDGAEEELAIAFGFAMEGRDMPIAAIASVATADLALARGETRR